MITHIRFGIRVWCWDWLIGFAWIPHTLTLYIMPLPMVQFAFRFISDNVHPPESL